MLFPELDADPFVHGEELKDIWIAVLRTALSDYWRGIRNGQHLKFLRGDEVTHLNRHDSESFTRWLTAAHWLTSDETCPRSFLWLAKHLQLEPEDVYSRMQAVPEDIEEEDD